jgi:hypothetical protein
LIIENDINYVNWQYPDGAPPTISMGSPCRNSTPGILHGRGSDLHRENSCCADSEGTKSCFNISLRFSSVLLFSGILLSTSITTKRKIIKLLEASILFETMGRVTNMCQEKLEKKHCLKIGNIM